jgi:hypothetical protein
MASEMGQICTEIIQGLKVAEPATLDLLGDSDFNRLGRKWHRSAGSRAMPKISDWCRHLPKNIIRSALRLDRRMNY